jgi:hypothetical protein
MFSPLRLQLPERINVAIKKTLRSGFALFHLTAVEGRVVPPSWRIRVSMCHLRGRN